MTDGGRHHAALIPLVRRPWLLRAGSADLMIRPAVARDLEAVANMHARCSARSLLDRYRTGGRGPSVTALHRQLRRPLAFVAATPRGAVLGVRRSPAIDENHGRESAEIGLLVEDEWQGIGIGREMMVHLAGGAPSSAVTPSWSPTPRPRSCRCSGCSLEVGTRGSSPDPAHSHLHLTLPESAALGLGAVRERLAS